MSKNVMLNVKPEFELGVFAQRLGDTYRAKGYDVRPLEMNGMYILTFSKNDSGLNHWMGLGEEIKVTCSVNNGVLTLALADDGAWTGKIVALVVGWFVCCIPFITGIVGCVRQTTLTKNVENDATMIVAGM